MKRSEAIQDIATALLLSLDKEDLINWKKAQEVADLTITKMEEKYNYDWDSEDEA